MGIYKNFVPLSFRYEDNEKSSIDKEPIYIRMHNLARDSFNFACSHSFFNESFDRKNYRAATATLLFPAKDFDPALHDGYLYIEITIDKSEKNPKNTHVRIDVYYTHSRFYVKKEKREFIAKLTYKAFIEYTDLLYGTMCSEEDFKPSICVININRLNLKYKYQSPKPDDMDPITYTVNSLVPGGKPLVFDKKDIPQVKLSAPNFKNDILGIETRTLK